MLKSEIVAQNGLGKTLLKDANALQANIIEVFAQLESIYSKWFNEPPEQPIGGQSFQSGFKR